jgi:tRNA1(Val) A37 N6-methylase TrmN6
VIVAEFEGLKTSVDAFHRGRFHLVQPVGGGHRSGIDAMLLAAMVPNGFAGQLADLGAGAGAAGMAVVSRCDAANITLVENDPVMAECARLSVALDQNKAFSGQIKIIEADVTLKGPTRLAAGLDDDTFDFVIFNPPFNDPSDRKTPDSRKQNAHVMGAALWEDWLRTATAIVKPGGHMALIARPESLGDILGAIGKRFGALRILSVHPHKDAAAIRILISGQKGSRARLALLPPHVLHELGSDAFLPEANAVNNGERALV